MMRNPYEFRDTYCVGHEKVDVEKLITYVSAERILSVEDKLLLLDDFTAFQLRRLPYPVETMWTPLQARTFLEDPHRRLVDHSLCYLERPLPKSARLLGQTLDLVQREKWTPQEGKSLLQYHYLGTSWGGDGERVQQLFDCCADATVVTGRLGYVTRYGIIPFSFIEALSQTCTFPFLPCVDGAHTLVPRDMCMPREPDIVELSEDDTVKYCTMSFGGDEPEEQHEQLLEDGFVVFSTPPEQPLEGVAVSMSLVPEIRPSQYFVVDIMDPGTRRVLTEAVVAKDGSGTVQIGCEKMSFSQIGSEIRLTTTRYGSDVVFATVDNVLTIPFIDRHQVPGLTFSRMDPQLSNYVGHIQGRPMYTRRNPKEVVEWARSYSFAVVQWFCRSVGLPDDVAWLLFEYVRYSTYDRTCRCFEAPDPRGMPRSAMSGSISIKGSPMADFTYGVESGRINLYIKDPIHWKHLDRLGARYDPGGMHLSISIHALSGGMSPRFHSGWQVSSLPQYKKCYTREPFPLHYQLVFERGLCGYHLTIPRGPLQEIFLIEGWEKAYHEAYMWNNPAQDPWIDLDCLIRERHYIL